jgi:hypothetical protein
MSTKKDMINPAELLKSQLAETNERIDTGDSIRIKNDGAGFTTPDDNSGKELNVVVIDYAMVHAYYDRAYDADNPMPPACFAVAQRKDDLEPVEDSPIPQAERCKVCPQNQFKSAANGKAKACKNTRLLAVVPVNDIAEAPLWLLSVPPSSTGKYDGYIKELADDHQLTPLFTATKVTQDKKLSYAAPRFALIDTLDKVAMASAITRMAEAKVLVNSVPDFSEYKAP